MPNNKNENHLVKQFMWLCAMCCDYAARAIIQPKQFQGSTYTLQPIYETNRRLLTLPAIYHTDMVTLCHMEKRCRLLSVHNYRSADGTMCALMSSCLTLDSLCLTLRLVPSSVWIFAENDKVETDMELRCNPSSGVYFQFKWSSKPFVISFVG